MKAMCILLAASAMSFVPHAEAQVWATGPNGQLGYVTTPNPISPDCVAPQVWTMTNGHYSCANPPSPPTPPALPPALPPSNPSPDAMCTANLPGGFVLGEQASFNSNWNNPAFASGTYSYGGFPTSDAAYAAPLYGPPYQNPCGVAEEDYIGYCAIKPNGSLDGEAQYQEEGSTGQCNH
jgi:hypothetical protein